MAVMIASPRSSMRRDLRGRLAPSRNLPAEFAEAAVDLPVGISGQFATDSFVSGKSAPAAQK